MLLESHCHTHFSLRKTVQHDGISSPEEMMARARALSLDGIAVTDHNTLRGAIEARKLRQKYGIGVIIGEEIDTIQGHLIGLDINETIPPSLDVEETIDRIHAQGGIAVAPHPFDIKRDGIGKHARHCDVIEVFNSMCIERVANWKAKRFAAKLDKPMSAGSDAHYTESLGKAVMRVKADTIEQALKGIRLGRAKITGSYTPIPTVVDIAVKRLQLSYHHTQGYIEDNYTWPKRFFASRSLPLVKYSPGKIDILFKLFTYWALSNAMMYAAIREILDI